MEFHDVLREMRGVRGSLEQTLATLGACQSDYWRRQPDRGYGAGGHLIHGPLIAESYRDLATHQLNLAGETRNLPFPLSEDLRAAAHDRNALGRINREQVHAVLSSFQGFHQFREWVIGRSTGLYQWLMCVPDDRAHWMMAHPLVKMRTQAATMLLRQIVIHFMWHMSQLTHGLNDSGVLADQLHCLFFGGEDHTIWRDQPLPSPPSYS